MRFTGYQLDGGYATHCLAKADFVLPLPEAVDRFALAPLTPPCVKTLGRLHDSIAVRGPALGTRTGE